MGLIYIKMRMHANVSCITPTLLLIFFGILQAGQVLLILKFFFIVERSMTNEID